jgi:hypothetical protein
VSEVTHQCSYNRFLHQVVIYHLSFVVVLVCKNDGRTRHGTRAGALVR